MDANEKFQIAKKIQETIDLLEADGDSRLQEAANLRAKTLAEYERAIASTLIRLKNGSAFVVDGETIERPPVSIMEKVAKGVCWQECFAMTKAEAMFKAALEWNTRQRAILNGYQSIHRYFDTV